MMAGMKTIFDIGEETDDIKHEQQECVQEYLKIKFDDFLKEQLQDPEFRKEYEILDTRHSKLSDHDKFLKQLGIKFNDFLKKQLKD